MSSFTEAEKLASSRASSMPKGSPTSGLNGWLRPMMGYCAIWACNSSAFFPNAYEVRFDVAGRRAHLTSRVAQALKENGYLFEETPSIETADVLAAHLPGG
jgi:hypothetical protein